MALSDKNIVITPNRGQASDPQIVFSGADASLGPQNVTVRVTPLQQGTLEINGQTGPIMSVSDLSVGSLFSVSGDDGIPKIDIDETGDVNLSFNTGALGLPVGTTAQRPGVPNPGFTRWNSSNVAMEIYDGTNWVELITDYFPSGSTILG